MGITVGIWLFSVCLSDTYTIYMGNFWTIWHNHCLYFDFIIKIAFLSLFIQKCDV